MGGGDTPGDPAGSCRGVCSGGDQVLRNLRDCCGKAKGPGATGGVDPVLGPGWRGDPNFDAAGFKVLEALPQQPRGLGVESEHKVTKSFGRSCLRPREDSPGGVGASKPVPDLDFKLGEALPTACLGGVGEGGGRPGKVPALTGQSHGRLRESPGGGGEVGLDAGEAGQDCVPGSPGEVAEDAKPGVKPREGLFRGWCAGSEKGPGSQHRGREKSTLLPGKGHPFLAALALGTPAWEDNHPVGPVSHPKPGPEREFRVKFRRQVGNRKPARLDLENAGHSSKVSRFPGA